MTLQKFNVWGLPLESKQTNRKFVSRGNKISTYAKYSIPQVTYKMIIQIAIEYHFITSKLEILKLTSR